MIWQRSPGMRQEIVDSGCYFMSILYAAAKRNTQVLLTVPYISDTLYNEVIDLGYMTGGCYIVRPDMIMNHIGMPVKYGGKLPPEYQCKHGEFSIDHYWYAPNDWHHFVTEGYDPWGISTTATKGIMTSRRIFRPVS